MNSDEINQILNSLFPYPNWWVYKDIGTPRLKEKNDIRLYLAENTEENESIPSFRLLILENVSYISIEVEKDYDRLEKLFQIT